MKISFLQANWEFVDVCLAQGTFYVPTLKQSTEGKLYLSITQHHAVTWCSLQMQEVFPSDKLAYW